MSMQPRKRRLSTYKLGPPIPNENESTNGKRQCLHQKPGSMVLDIGPANSMLPMIQYHGPANSNLHQPSREVEQPLDARAPSASPPSPLLNIEGNGPGSLSPIWISGGSSLCSGLDNDSIFGSPSGAEDQYSPLGHEIGTPPDSLLVDEDTVMTERNRCDICFGMISAKIIDRQSVAEKSPLIPIQLSREKDIMRLETSLKCYVGLMEPQISKELGQMIQKYGVSSDAFIVNRRGNSRAKLPESIDEKHVYIVMYGDHSNREAVGWHLSDKRIYLQHPLVYNTSIIYDNPHYFLPPGETIPLPSICDLSLGDEQAVPKAGLLDDALEIFEGAAVTKDNQIKDLGPIAGLRTILKEHQKIAVAFMMEKEDGRVGGNDFGCLWEEIHPNGGRCNSIQYRNVVTEKLEATLPSLPLGGLLADSMGLGKSLATLALIAVDVATARTSSIRQSPTLIVAPASTLIGWKDQIERHFETGTFRLHVYHGDQRLQDSEHISSYDIIVTTYDTLVSDTKNKGQLQRITWRRVVLDEAHFIKDNSTKRFKATCLLKSKYRWCLTGTPIQNRIDDFAALLGFLQMHPFDRKFKKLILDPLNNGNPSSVQKLRLLVNSISLRRTKAFLGTAIQLPPRQDHVENIEFSKDERTLYDRAAKCASTLLQESVGGNREYQSILQAILRLRQICNHNTDLWPVKLRVQFRDPSEAPERAGGDFFAALDSCENCGGEIQANSLPGVAASCPHILCGMCTTGAQGARAQNPKRLRKTINHACPLCFPCGLDSEEQDSHPQQKQRPKHWQPSSKVKALIKNLQKDQPGQEDGPPKSIVFSGWTTMLDFVEIALEHARIGFERLDGKMSLKQRYEALRRFRNNPHCQVLLASVQCAGVGIDLTAASRVHLLEPQWNPSSEEQALDRVHRMGQTRPVETYRYIVKESIDEYVVELQRQKLHLMKISFGGESSPQSLETLKSLLR